MRIILIIVCLFFQSKILFSQALNHKYYDELDQQVYFDNTWKLRKVGDTSWIKDVKFPNTIHEILFEKNIIENPYFGNNEQKLKWVEESDWEAVLEFDLFDETKNTKHILYFEGIEPYAKIYLNDHFIGESKNSFIPLELDVTQYARENETNTLRILFESPVKREKEIASKNKIVLPGDERVYSRKPQYEYGWDWGPRFVTTGIKKEIYYHRLPVNYLYFEDARIINSKISDKEAVLTCELSIYSNVDQTVTLKLNEKYNDIKFTTTLKLKKGINKFNKEISIDNPHLWWPHNLGDPVTYNFNFYLTGKENKYIAKRGEFTIIHAITEIKLIQNKDSLGESFYFLVNDKKCYLKGFNLIPYDHFKPDHSSIYDLKDATDSDLSKANNFFENLIQMNVNTVRIWGGGNYISDDDIRFCMMFGIIIWQDFMFAGAMYPGDPAFLQNVEEEITYQIKRLRNYNNIALYCGNNEIDEAWHNWGWQKQYNYSKEDSTKIWNDYVKLFHELIPSIIKKYDPDTDYIPSSPEIGWGRKESMTQGDSHYWGVWWGKEPIETFEEKIPRFMSEFGMQAIPDLSTLRKVIPDSLMNFDSPEFKNHQKHPTGFETLNYYLEKYLTVPTDMGDYAYATQLLQAITLEKAIKAQRMSGKCMGTLIWQLNDTWPVTSWSVIDSEGKKKMAYDYVKAAFQNDFYNLEKDSSGYNLLFYKGTEKADGKFELSISLTDFSGKIYLDTILQLNLTDGVNQISHFSKEKMKKYKLNELYLNAKCKYLNVNSILYFEDLNKLNLSKPDLNFSCTRTTFSYTVTVESFSSLHYVHYIDKTYWSEKRKEIPTELNGGEKLSFGVPYADFINEQDAINYVKKNLKSINHLLGK
jgi:beta-mannosidase